VNWFAALLKLARTRATRIALELPAMFQKGQHRMSNFQLLDDETATITIKTTDDSGTTEPVPAGDVFTAVSAKPASLQAAIGADAAGNPALILTPLVQASTSIAVTVSDSKGLAEASLAVDIVQDTRPANIVLDVADATFTPQAAPTAPGP
jgi:hypothetical protein